MSTPEFLSYKTKISDILCTITRGLVELLYVCSSWIMNWWGKLTIPEGTHILPAHASSSCFQFVRKGTYRSFYSPKYFSNCGVVLTQACWSLVWQEDSAAVKGRCDFPITWHLMSPQQSRTKTRQTGNKTKPSLDLCCASIRERAAVRHCPKHRHSAPTE